MVKLEGFVSEDTLQELLYKGEIDHLDFVQHHSEEMTEDFGKFCARNGLEQNDQAAQQFVNWKLKEEKQAHTDNLD